MRGKCERGQGSANADGAGAEVFAGDGCSQGASFGPMAAISRRGQSGRIYNNTRARVLLRRMCVKPAALTTHSPPKTSARPRTATRPARALPPAPAAQTHTRRPHHPFPAEDLLPPRAFSHPLPSTSTPPRSADAHPPTSQHIPHRRSAPAPAQRRALPEHFLTPSPPRRTPAGCAMHSSPTSQHIPRRRPAPAPAQRHALPEHFLTPSPPRRTPAGCAMHARRPHNPFLAEGRHPSPHSDTCLPFCSASGTKKRHRTVDVRCRMSRSTVVAVGHWGW